MLIFFNLKSEVNYHYKPMKKFKREFFYISHQVIKTNSDATVCLYGIVFKFTGLPLSQTIQAHFKNSYLLR